MTVNAGPFTGLCPPQAGLDQGLWPWAVGRTIVILFFFQPALAGFPLRRALARWFLQRFGPLQAIDRAPLRVVLPLVADVLSPPFMVVPGW